MNLKILKVLLFSYLSCFKFMGNPGVDENDCSHFEFTDPVLEMLNERLESLPKKETINYFDQALFECLIFEINGKNWYALEDYQK